MYTVVCFSSLLVSTRLVAMSGVQLVAMSGIQIPDNLLHDIVLICFVDLLSFRRPHIDTNLFSFRFSSSCFLCFILVVFCGETRAGQLSLVPGSIVAFISCIAKCEHFILKCYTYVYMWQLLHEAWEQA